MGLAGEAFWRAYEGAGWAAMPLAAPYLKRRAARGKEDAVRFAEKLGHTAAPAPQTPSVWCHAVSVGEASALLPLAAALSQWQSVVFTTGTPMAAERVAAYGARAVPDRMESFAPEKLPAFQRFGHFARADCGAKCPSLTHQYAPLDALPFLRRFAERWQPSLAIFAESEVWPATVRHLSRRQVPIVQANARLSARSGKRWRQMSFMARSLFSKLSLVLAQTAEDAARYTALGAPRVETVGNLKFDAPPLPVDWEAVRSLREAIGQRPVFLAASTHPGDEEIVLAAHRQLLSARPDWLTIIAPRHHQRGPAIAALAREFGAGLRSAGDAPLGSVYVADTHGELGSLFAVAPVVLLAGSFGNLGGHNPAEPAAAGAAMLTGPDHGPMFLPFITSGAAEVVTPGTLASAVLRLAGDNELAQRRSDAARATLGVERGALSRTLERLQPMLVSGQVAS
ncbi:MAG: glycosyltransferase N-terminal domain-containing protein [Pseudomonadota bacterium]